MLAMRLSSGLVALVLAFCVHAVRETPSQEDAASASTSVILDGAGKPLRECEAQINVLAGDIVTMEHGGPDYKEMAQNWKNKSKAVGRVLTALPRKVMELYSNKKQINEHTDKIAWTHVELGIDTDTLMSAYNEQGVEADQSPCLLRTGYAGSFVVSRYIGKHQHEYRKLASERAKMWQPYLDHYAKTMGEWWPVLKSSCLATKSPGEDDYFQAVNEEKVYKMWWYDPDVKCDGDAKGRWKRMKRWVKDRFRTHDNSGMRCKPKAMFCSKFVTAVWSSVIGNPTAESEATRQTDDLKKMWPFKPGACTPWGVLKWLLSQEASQFWDSCLVKSYRDFGCNTTTTTTTMTMATTTTTNLTSTKSTQK